MTSVIEFEAVAFAVDQQKRTLSGVLLPFGAVSRPAQDPETGKVARYSFAEGSIELPDPGDVVLNFGHDTKSLAAQVGIATHLEAKPDGVHASFRVARTPEGDRVLALAEDRILKAFSAEVTGQFAPGDGDVQHAKTTRLTGAAVVRTPAFEGAQITHVAAQAAPTPEESTVTDQVLTEAVEVSVSLSADDVRGIVADEFKRAMETDLRPSAPTAQFEVREEPVYRFDGRLSGSGYDFSTDLVRGVVFGEDGEARKRVQTFINDALTNAEFVATTDTAPANPSTYRPDMFKDEGPAQRTPLSEAFYKGPLSDVTPFFYSQLGSYSGPTSGAPLMVNPHTEGVEPGNDSFSIVSGQTITPEPLSGKIFVTREVIDQGGNPNVSALIWTKFLRDFAKGTEARAYAKLLSGVGSYTALSSLSTAASGVALTAPVEAGLVGLRFRADGSRFTRFFAAQDLFTNMAAARDSDGRPFYAQIGATNANGGAESKWGSLDVGGYLLEPTASLKDTTVSYVVDPSSSVMQWVSGLTRLAPLGEEVRGYSIGAWAYSAEHLYDTTGVLKLVYAKA